MRNPNFKLFQNNPEKSYKLIAILNMDLKYPNYFNTLFEDIETGEQSIEKIIPELFRKKFKIGYIYRNNKIIQLANYKEGIFKIKITGNEKYRSEMKYPHKIDDKYSNQFNKQLYYEIDIDGGKLIIPTNIIGIRYYFLSSAIKKSFNNGNLDNLYYPNTNKYFFRDNKYQIDVTTRANKKDIPFICRFLNRENSYTRNSFSFFNQSKLNTYQRFGKEKDVSIYSTFLCRFPVLGEYNIHCKYILVGTDEQKVYLVTDIYNDESPLGFENLHSRRYKQGTPPDEISKIPYAVLKYKGRKRGSLRSATTCTSSTSSSIINETLVEKVAQDLNTVGLNITNEDIYTGGNIVIEINPEVVSTTPSFEDYETNLDNSSLAIQKILSKEIDKMNDPFYLSHFITLFEELRQNPLIYDSKIYKPTLMSIIPNRIKSLLNKEKDVPRPYLYGFFEYCDKFIYFIEIQEDDSWKQSTWFFVSEECLNFNYNVSFSIIKEYILNPRYSLLYDYCIDNFKLSMFLKKHTKNIYSEDHTDNWVQGIFKLIDLTDEERHVKIHELNKNKEQKALK